VGPELVGCGLVGRMCAYVYGVLGAAVSGADRPEALDRVVARAFDLVALG
jgi:hypothetical protein